MIRSFRSKALREFFETGSPRRLSVPHTARVGRILRALDDAERPLDLNLPGLRFHPLKGANRGRYALDVSGNWRITFGWDQTDATDVDLEDYH
jgi:proteic killer suppression protein